MRKSSKSLVVLMLSLMLIVSTILAFTLTGAGAYSAPQDELIANGDFENMVTGEATEAILGSKASNGWSEIFSADDNYVGKFVKADGNVTYRLGGDKAGTLWNGNGANKLLQYNFNLYKEGTYTLSFDIKANGDIVKYTQYLRTFFCNGGGDLDVLDIITMRDVNNYTEALSTADWETAILDMTSLGDGWYRYSRRLVLSKDAGYTVGATSNQIRFMSGTYAGTDGTAFATTADDYFEIDNVSLCYDDGEVILNGDLENMVTGEATETVLGSKASNGWSEIFSADDNYVGKFVKADGNVTYRLGGDKAGTLWNGNGANKLLQYNFTFFTEGKYVLSFDIKANGDIVKYTQYLRTFFCNGSGDLDVAEIITMRAVGTYTEELSTADWEEAIGNMRSLGNGWYRCYTTVTLSKDNGYSVGKNTNQLRFMSGTYAGDDGTTLATTADDYFEIDNVSLRLDDGEVIENGSFEDMVTGEATEAILGSKASNGWSEIFSADDNYIGKFVKADGNVTYRLGGEKAGTLWNDNGANKLLQYNFNATAEGKYVLTFDIKANGDIVKYTQYLRTFFCNGGGDLDVLDIITMRGVGTYTEELSTADWTTAVDNMVSLGNGWYRYSRELEITKDGGYAIGKWTNQIRIMSGTYAGDDGTTLATTADDYFEIDNVSLKYQGSSEEEEESSELIVGGDFEDLTEGALPQGQFANFSSGSHGTFVKDGDNMVFKFGGAGGGFTNMDYVFDTGVNYGKVKNGTYTFEMDIKPSESVIAKTNYLRLQAGPSPAYVQYIILDRTIRDFEDTDIPSSDIPWTTAVESFEAKENGWYHVSVSWDVDDGVAGETLWLMMGLTTGSDKEITATDDDYYLIDNLSFQKTSDAEEVDDGSVEIPEEEQVELFSGFDKILGSETKVKITGDSETNGIMPGTEDQLQGGYVGQAPGWVEKGQDSTGAETAVFCLGYTQECTLVNENGWNMGYYCYLNFDEKGSGYYTLSFDIKANGDVVKATRYLRTFLNGGDKTMTYMISMNSTNPTKEWNDLIANKDTDNGTMTDLGNGWYRYSRTFVVSNAKNNTDCLWVVIQQGGDYVNEDGESTYGTDNVVSTQVEGEDYYSICNMSIKKVREIAEYKPKLASDAEATKTFDAKNPQDVTINIKWNTCELQVVKAKHTSESDYVSLGSVAAAKNVTWTEDDGSTPGTLVIKKEWLSTLKKNGDYSVQIVTLERTMEVTITVSNYEEPADDSEEESGEDVTPTTKKGCGSSIAMTSIVSFASLIAAGFAVARKRKED